MTDETHKILPGGSIDYAYYVTRGRKIRSRSFLDALGTLAAFLSRGSRSKVDTVANPPREGQLVRRTRDSGWRFQRRPLEGNRATGSGL